MSATQYWAYAFVIMVGVTLEEGVGVALVVIDWDGVGVGEGDELQAPRSKAIATVETVKTAGTPDLFMLQIYPV